MMWLAGIMVLPVMTVVQLDGRHDPSALALYLGTMASLMLMSRGEEMLLALIVPALGTFPLFILLLARPIRRLSRRLLGGSGQGVTEEEATG